MTENNELKTYDFIEGSEFTGLAPKAMEGYSTGKGAGYSHLFRYSVPDALEVISIDALFEGGNGGNGGNGDDKPEEPVVEQPTVTENTDEQTEAENEIIAGMSESASGKYTMSAESVNNITVPSTATRTGAISGDVQNGATFTNETTNKSLMVYNTSEEPSDVSVITNGGSVYLKGDYNDIYLEGKALPVESSQYPNVHGTVSVADTDQNVAVSVNFVGKDCGVTYLGDEALTITDGVTAETASPTIYAPNATVTMNGKYDEVTATVSENTLILNSSFHANKLVVLKGNIHVNGLDIADFVDELEVPEGCVITTNEFHVTQDSNAKLMGSSPANGKVILDTNIELTKGRTFGVLASGKELIDLNGHEWKCGDSRTGTTTGSFYLRGTANVTIDDTVGGGKFINNHEDYLIWAAADGVVVNIKGGEFQGYTHVLYAYAGTINVYGGTFKMLGENEDKDVNGNYKFLLNCYDANYTAGTAHINVYGGKFYGFNPAVSYGEPGGPVSFVAEGYTVEESVEDGVKVYEVVPVTE